MYYQQKSSATSNRPVQCPMSGIRSYQFLNINSVIGCDAVIILDQLIEDRGIASRLEDMLRRGNSFSTQQSVRREDTQIIDF